MAENKDGVIEKNESQAQVIAINASGASTQPIYKSILPYILILFGILGLIIPLGAVIILLPQVTLFISDTGGGSFGVLNALPLLLILGYFIGQIFYGVSLLRKQKKAGGINKIQRTWSILFLIAGIVVEFLFIPALMMSVIIPIYNGLTTIN